MLGDRCSLQVQDVVHRESPTLASRSPVPLDATDIGGGESKALLGVRRRHHDLLPTRTLSVRLGEIPPVCRSGAAAMEVVAAAAVARAASVASPAHQICARVGWFPGRR